MSQAGFTDPSTTITSAFEAVATTLLDISERLMYAGQLAEAITFLRHGVQIMQSSSAPPVEYARLLIGHGRLLSLENFQGIGDFDGTLRILEEGRVTAAYSGDQRLRADAVDLLGMTRYYRVLAGQGGSFDDSLPSFSEALALREELGDTRGIAETVFHIGLIDQNMTRWDAARRNFEQAIAVARAGNHPLELSYAVRHLGFVELHDDNLPAAQTCLEESLAVREAIGFRLFLPFSQLALADVMLRRGEHASAGALAAAALEVATELGSPSQTIFALITLGEVAQVTECLQDARNWYQRALETAQSANLERAAVLATRRLAALDAAG